MECLALELYTGPPRPKPSQKVQGVLAKTEASVAEQDTRGAVEPCRSSPVSKPAPEAAPESRGKETSTAELPRKTEAEVPAAAQHFSVLAGAARQIFIVSGHASCTCMPFSCIVGLVL